MWAMHAHLQTGEFVAALGFYDIIHAMQLFADNDDEVGAACTCTHTRTHLIHTVVYLVPHNGVLRDTMGVLWCMVYGVWCMVHAAPISLT